MKTFDIYDKSGRLVAFEIGNTLVSMQGIRKILGTIPDLRVLPNGSEDDNKLSFAIKDHVFVVWEPWSDSSRYWIGPADIGSKSDEMQGVIEIVHSKFRETPWAALFLRKKK